MNNKRKSDTCWGQCTFAAQLAYASGKLERAKELFEKALELAENNHSIDKVFRAHTLTSLASCNLQLGLIEEASAQITEAVAIYRDSLPRSHPNLVESYHLKANVHHQKKEHAEAQSWYRQTIENMTHLPHNHPEKVTVMGNYLGLLNEMAAR